MNPALMRLTEKLDAELPIDQDYVLHGMAFFLAAIIAFLLIRIFGALDTSLGSIMAKRGTLSWLCTSASTEQVCTEGSPNRSANCSMERAGASPRVLRVLCSTGNNVWIH